jgi:type III secretion protein N (ATPase)
MTKQAPDSDSKSTAGPSSIIDIERRLSLWSEHAISSLHAISRVTAYGRVNEVLGPVILGSVPQAQIGELCELTLPSSDAPPIIAEVVGFSEKSTVLSPLSKTDGLSAKFRIRPLRKSHHVTISPALLGRVLDGFGNPLDGLPYPASTPNSIRVKVIADAPPPTERPRIIEPFPTGVRAIDGLLTIGNGQRIGVFAGPGCGKTTIMAAIARGAEVDAIVFGLIGERGREVREFTEHELTPDLLAKSVLVCATSDRTPIERTRAAFTATAIAEGLRDSGLRVLLLIDSLTRLARAQREIGLSAGEPPARAGFPPSVYSLMPRLIERAGRIENGAITAIYTVLLEGEVKGDPISEEAMSLLDGHILLSRRLAEKGQYPAIDVLPSISRVMGNIVTSEHRRAAGSFRRLLSRYNEMELLIKLGEYKAGMDEESDLAVEMYPYLIDYLKQDTAAPTAWEDNIAQLIELQR